jgi:radical SAM protein with 4Fe4S-binding SPASM domain
VEVWQETFGLQIQIQRRAEEKLNCGIGRFFSINPDGSVYPCHVLSFPEFYLGNVRNDALFSIYHSSPLLQKMKNLRFSKIALCIDCIHESSKEGTCLGIHAQEAHHRKQLLQAIK